MNRIHKILEQQLASENMDLDQIPENLLLNISQTYMELETRLSNSDHNHIDSVGELAAGVAHEVNNPLMIIQGNIFLLDKLTTFSDEKSEALYKERIIKINDNIQRIATILESLRILAVNNEVQDWEIVDSHFLVEQSLNLCNQKIQGIKAQLKLNSKPSDIMIRCIPGDIVKVIFSLLSNSIDAIEFSKEKWITIDVTTNDNSVYFKITDSGSGIKNDIISKIFNPFFSTKAPGKGSGLGLSISKKVIKKYGGDLIYDRSSGVTCFILSIPIATMNKICKTA
jgi:signal transduction histidine kinase